MPRSIRESLESQPLSGLVLSPRSAAQSSVRAAGIDAVFERKEAEIKSPAPSLIGPTRRCAMNMSVTQLLVQPAVVGCKRSVWRQIIDTVIEGPPRTAADEIDEYLARHQHDLSPTLRIELERRHVCL